MTKAAIFDIDGTLANCEHRRHHVEGRPKDWDAFYAAMDRDEPIEAIAELARLLRAAGTTIIICTSRPSNYCETTLAWLDRHGIAHDALYMREAGDHRDDAIIKREMLVRIREVGYAPHMAIDDRAKVVRMWREEGLLCLQCAPGEF